MKLTEIKRFISLVVAFQLAIVPFTTTYVSAANDASNSSGSELEGQLNEMTQVGSELPEAREIQEKFEELSNEIESAGERDFPKSTPNAFHIADQRFVLTSHGDSTEYNLSRFNLD
ncbi:MAG: hypothetical protein KDD38_09335, partial [Bdellovibrionales bacterium]|nr:hypothetical protein [Bdellovibrionales bacterium]